MPMIEPRPKPGKGDSITSHNHNASVYRLRQTRKSHNKDKLQGSPCLPVGMLTEISSHPDMARKMPGRYPEIHTAGHDGKKNARH